MAGEMRIKVTRAFYLAGEKLQTVGTEITLPEGLAREQIAMNRAVKVEPPKRAAKAEEGK